MSALTKLGVHETVSVPRDVDESPQEERDCFEVRRFRYALLRRGRLAFGAGIMPNIRRNPWLICQLPGLLFSFFVAALRQRRCHIVHANWLMTAIPGALYSLLTGVPLVVTARGEDVPFYSFAIRRPNSMI